MKRLFSPHEKIGRKTYGVGVIIGVLAFFALWTAVSAYYAKEGKSVLFPGPSAIWEVTVDISGYGEATTKKIDALRESSPPGADLDEEIKQIREKARAPLYTLGDDLWTSFIRVTTAFLLAAAIGVPLGLLMGCYRMVEATTQPIMEFMRYVPVPALVPVLIIVFGVDETPKIMLIFIGTFYQLVIMVSDEARKVGRELIRSAYSLGATRFEIVTKVIRPHAMPGIFDCLRLCNGWAWTWLIVAELVAANEGMGFRIIRFQRYLQTDKIFLYLLILGLIGLCIDFLFRRFNQACFRWNEIDRSK